MWFLEIDCLDYEIAFQKNLIIIVLYLNTFGMILLPNEAVHQHYTLFSEIPQLIVNFEINSLPLGIVSFQLYNGGKQIGSVYR